jgi:hypothetical protein
MALAASATAAKPARFDFLVVPEDEPWTAAVAAPVAAVEKAGSQAPLLIALGTPPTREAEQLVELAAPKHPLVLATVTEPKLGRALERCGAEVMAIGPDPVRGSLLVAKRFWGRPRQVVVAAVEDAEGVLFGGALAARMSIPLLLAERTETRAKLGEALQDLGVEEALAAVADADHAPLWANARGKYNITILGPRAVQDRLVDAIGRSGVHTIVVARVPEKRSGAGQSAWLAPYLGLLRDAPLVLSHAPSAALAEAAGNRLIADRRLRPRSITILADYDSLGDNVVDIDTGPQPPAPLTEAAAAAAAEAKLKYRVNTEPFVPTRVGAVGSFGVGRIPLQSLADASVLFARGLLRERLADGREPRVLMVSNSGRRALPLCETISRVTAEEYKNCRIPVDEFYGKLADSPEVLAAAKTAGVIIYEGHLAYQDLFDVPSAHRDTAPDSYFEEELDNLEESGPPPAAPPTTPLRTPRRTARPAVNQINGTMEGLPVVILQSCDSLDERVLWRVDELGGVALVGSVTPIHSGSGSGLVKALGDAVLYRGATLGEALRDAQNYLFCLEDLKTRRGQKEQAKSRRVALSFRLWGDPELQVLPAAARTAPESPPLALRPSGPDELVIEVPRHRLPEARNDKYYARMFPGSQPAGMVKQPKREAARQVTPVYFFRVPLPEDFVAADGAMLAGPGGQTNQAACRVDAIGRSLYVLFFPELEKAGETIVLRRSDEAPPARWGRHWP